MIKKTNFFCYALMISALLSFDKVNNYDVKRNEVIIKFHDTFSPKLGLEPAITAEQFYKLFPFVENLQPIGFVPLFFDTQNFKSLEYKHKLHHYYIFTFDKGRRF